MIDLHAAGTSNGMRARIALEECGLEYKLHPVALPKKEQLSDEFKKLHIGHKIPVLVDPDGPGGRVVVPESPAILRYEGQ